MQKNRKRKTSAGVTAILLIAAMLCMSLGAYAEGEAGGGTPPGGGMPGGADTMTYDYTGTLEGICSADGTEVTSSAETIASTQADVNAALASNGGTLTITKGTLTKSGDDDNGDNCNFYGINSIVLSSGDESLAAIDNSDLSAESSGSNALFATDGATIYAYKDTIHTTADNSRGLDATYGGTVIGTALTITTEGDHCAALATDRGGGYISVTDSSLSTKGSGSPLLYSTGDIEVSNLTGTASGSQIAGMEGLNTILIYDSELSSSITDATASDPVANGIILYQSTSGDAEAKTGDSATFQAVNSSLSSSISSGAMFYVTNTTANILLQNTVLSFDSEAADLLYIAGNDANNWGTAGSNGGTVSLTARQEQLEGNITVDTISSLNLYLLEGTTYTGAIRTEENANGTSSESGITVNLDADSVWVVTEDTTIANLNAEAGSKIVDANGDPVSIVAGGSTVQQGTGSVTVTVTGSYGTAVTTDAGNELYTDYIDRTAFDERYGTETAFSAETLAAETDTAADSGSGTESAATEEQGGQSSWVLILVLVLIAAAILVGILVHSRRRKKE